MELVALKKYKTPKYPLKHEVLHNPILLKKLPERWKFKAMTCATMSTALILMLTSCKPNQTAIMGGIGPMITVTLSEEDALIIINDEAKKQGLDFTKDGTQLDNIDIPYNYSTYNNVLATRNDNLILDGYDANSKIGFEYISSEDIQAWTNVQYSVQFGLYETFSLVLSNSIKDKIKDKNVGVFFDFYSNDQASREKELRMQVQDFLNWLKAQGII